MNREIKFRAWDTIEKIWVYDLGISAPKWIKGHDRIQVMQFSGWLDKNKKEIYEGDIIELINKDGDTIRVVCEFGSAKRDIYGNEVEIMGFYFKHEQGFKSFPIVKNYLGKHDCELFEIIGNIYENSDQFKIKENE